MGKVVVIGGGAAGLFAAYSAALNNKQVILLERNEKLGKKIYITGKGRCNLTTSVPMDEFFNYISYIFLHFTTHNTGSSVIKTKEP